MLKFPSIPYPKSWQFWMASGPVPEILFHVDFSFPFFFSFQNLYPKYHKIKYWKQCQCPWTLFLNQVSRAFSAFLKTSTDYNFYALFWDHFLILTPLSLYDFINSVLITVCFWLSPQTLSKVQEKSSLFLCSLQELCSLALCHCEFVSGLRAAGCFDVSLH